MKVVPMEDSSLTVPQLAEMVKEGDGHLDSKRSTASGRKGRLRLRLGIGVPGIQSAIHGHHRGSSPFLQGKGRRQPGQSESRTRDNEAWT